jgi:hypothetical protein
MVENNMVDYFSVNESQVEAEVYRDTVSNGSPVFLVKIKLLEIGTYISGIRVQKSPKRPEDGLWVQLPAAKVGARYFKIIECAGSSPFLEIIERKAKEAVESYLGGKNNPFPTIQDTKGPDEEPPVNLDDIPF